MASKVRHSPTKKMQIYFKNHKISIIENTLLYEDQRLHQVGHSEEISVLSIHPRILFEGFKNPRVNLTPKFSFAVENFYISIQFLLIDLLQV